MFFFVDAVWARERPAFSEANDPADTVTTTIVIWSVIGPRIRGRACKFLLRLWLGVAPSYGWLLLNDWDHGFARMELLPNILLV